ncbi:MAG TPA: arginine deiminase [Propionibacteriaceae bacterium]|nr:arginine deiminase [Propionibacteriaceae bacterium]
MFTAPRDFAGEVGVHSETGRLRTVMLHRPGAELLRLTPRNNDALLFDGIPWVGRAQDEHDAFADVLRSQGVEVLLLAELLVESLSDAAAREQGIASTLDDLRLGETLRTHLAGHLAGLSPDDLAAVMIAGLRNDEVGVRTLVTSLKAHDDFIIDPLPNLLFTRDSSLWIGKHPVVTSLAMHARRRESQLTELIYTFHPRFSSHERLHGATLEHVEGGDVLVLADGVLAVGVGERTTPAGVERLTRDLFERGLVTAVVAVPIEQERATMHLDTICTMVDVDAVIMYPNVASRLQGHLLTWDGDLRIAESAPFLEACASAMGIERLRLIDTGLDAVTAEREQWDDGNNTLAVAPRVAVAYERNVETNSRLEEAGIEVIAISGSELGSGRGGPRCMSCPIARDTV